MSEILAILSVFTLTIAVVAAFEYYRRLIKVRGEYEKSKNALSDVVLSFSRELKRLSEKIDPIYYKVEAAAMKGSEAFKKVELFEKELHELTAKIMSALEDCKKLHVKLAEVEKRTSDVAASHEALATKISNLEAKEFSQNLHSIMETGLDAAIPIRRERALAPLTETELVVLETLASEGPKTAPEIKNKIRLSREHTARLMKKLYEEGYLDRDSTKIPFKYGIKKEMEKLLKRTETKTA